MKKWKIHRLYLLTRGRWRVHYGFCPLCGSNPPVPSCIICLGDYEYGVDAVKSKRKDWLRYYERMLQLLSM